MSRDRGIPSLPYNATQEQVASAVREIISYINQGADSILDRGLTDHALIWAAKTHLADRYRVACGIVTWQHSGTNDSSQVRVYWDGRSEAIGTAANVTNWSMMGDPRFSQNPAIFLQRYRRIVSPTATDVQADSVYIVHVPQNEADDVLRRYFNVIGYQMDGSNFTDEKYHRVFYLGIGPATGG